MYVLTFDPRASWDGDEGDDIRYDTFYAPSAAQLEAEAIRRECYGLDSDD